LIDDIYIRYLSFENEAEMEKEICNRNPFKIDIGPVMQIRPKDHRTVTSLHALQRELVFDIDMTDYDEIRTCCSEANVCQKCWKFMTIACRVLDVALREDFNFEHILWVFSGRRGIHAWVCDKDARHLDGRGRSAIVEYLSLLVSSVGEGAATRCIINNDRMHHSIKRAYKIVEPFFNEICLEDQDLFGNANGVSLLLKLVPDEKVRKDLEKHLAQYPHNSKIVWQQFTNFFESLRVQSSLPRRLKFVVEEVQMALLYPRLDINVSKTTNHLLKAPFCVHPKTGKVCVPFNVNAASKFDPDKSPVIK
jgi:DNA primase small subunit